MKMTILKIVAGLLGSRFVDRESRYSIGHSLLHIEKSLKVVPLESNDTTNKSKEKLSNIEFSEIEPFESNENQDSVVQNNHSIKRKSNVITPENDKTKAEENVGKKNTNETALDRRVSHADYDQDTLGKLEEVISAGKQLRSRLLLVTTSFGTFMVIVCVTMQILLDEQILSSSIFGRSSIYESLINAWGCFLFFGIMPDDVLTARVVSMFFFGGLTLFGVYSAWLGISQWTVQRHEFVEDISDGSGMCGSNLPYAGCFVEASDNILITVINLVYAYHLRPNFARVKKNGKYGKFYDRSRPKGYRFSDNSWKRSSREALEAIWEGGRLYTALMGLRSLFLGLLAFAFGDKYAPTFSNGLFADKLIYGFINVSLPIIYTPKRRQRIIAFFTKVIVEDETKSAASVAALLGNMKAADSLDLAKEKFRTICFSKLSSDDFSSNREDADNMNELFEETEKTDLGECDVFLSHSWHDNSKKKYRALKRWCDNFKTKHGRYPRLWLDKACIDQKEIASDLLCLPLFLAGCETLLIIAGPTYTERLWCVMEVFVFLQMGGSIHRVTVIAIDAKDEQEAKSSFEVADINKCKCHLASDRKKLLGIVQQGFGSFDTFNSVIRQVFKERMFEERITLEEKITVLASQNCVLTEKVDIIKDQALMLANQAKMIEQLTNEMSEIRQLIEK